MVVDGYARHCHCRECCSDFKDQVIRSGTRNPPWRRWTQTNQTVLFVHNKMAISFLFLPITLTPYPATVCSDSLPRSIFSLYSTRSAIQETLFKVTANRAGSRFRIFSISCPQNGKRLSDRILWPAQRFCPLSRQIGSFFRLSGRQGDRETGRQGTGNQGNGNQGNENQG